MTFEVRNGILAHFSGVFILRSRQYQSAVGSRQYQSAVGSTSRQYQFAVWTWYQQCPPVDIGRGPIRIVKE